MEIADASGRLWMSPDVTPLNMVQRLDYTFTQGSTYTITTAVSASSPIMFFSRITGTGGTFGCIMQQSGGFWQIVVTAVYTEDGTPGNISARFYIFSNTVTTPSRYSIAYYDAGGVMRWHGEMRPLQLFQGSINNTAGGVFNAGFRCAVCSFFSSLYLIRYSGGTPAIYQWAETAYSALDSNIRSNIVNVWTNNTSSYTTYSIPTFYYINVALYDK